MVEVYLLVDSSVLLAWVAALAALWLTIRLIGCKFSCVFKVPAMLKEEKKCKRGNKMVPCKKMLKMKKMKNKRRKTKEITEDEPATSSTADADEEISSNPNSTKKKKCKPKPRGLGSMFSNPLDWGTRSLALTSDDVTGDDARDQGDESGDDADDASWDSDGSEA